jgi:hypothetical protein
MPSHKQCQQKPLSRGKREKAYKDSSNTRYVILSATLFSLLAPFIHNFQTAIIIILIFTNCLTLAYIYLFIPKPYRRKYRYDAEIALKAKYEVICADAISWLNEVHEIPGYVVTSLPDFRAMNMDVEKWRTWFYDVVHLIMQKLPDGHCAIFYQTDSKVRGPNVEGKWEQLEWIDKSVIVHNAASSVPGVKLLWHKIMDRTNDEYMRANVGFSHLLCFGKNRGMTMERNEIPDVLERGELIYKNSVGINPCMIATLFCRSAGAQQIVDPFCGKGSFLMAANYMGMDALGIDINKKCARQATLRGERVTRGFATLVEKYSFLDITNT